jgi:hypothetical protein
MHSTENKLLNKIKVFSLGTCSVKRTAAAGAQSEVFWQRFFLTHPSFPPAS